VQAKERPLIGLRRNVASGLPVLLGTARPLQQLAVEINLVGDRGLPFCWGGCLLGQGEFCPLVEVSIDSKPIPNGEGGGGGGSWKALPAMLSGLIPNGFRIIPNGFRIVSGREVCHHGR
jgi:hypothetical protein